MGRADSDRRPTDMPSVSAAVDTTRPFGAHVRLAWWKPLVLVVVLSVCLVGFQLVAWTMVGVLEGSDAPFSSEFSPLKSLAVNLSIGATGVVAVVLLIWMTGAPWRLLVSPRGAFDRRRLAHYSVGALVLVAAGLVTTALVAPESTGWTSFGVSGTTIALLAVTVLTTPIQAVGEELTYRGVLLPATASWMRAVRPALALGIAVSVVLFAAAHGSTDPWLAGYFAVIAVCTALTAIISGGIEAPIAFHVVNNVLFGIVDNVMDGGGTSDVDRSSETGGPSLLILAAVNVAMVGFVWVRERRRQAVLAAAACGSTQHGRSGRPTL